MKTKIGVILAVLALALLGWWLVKKANTTPPGPGTNSDSTIVIAGTKFKCWTDSEGIVYLLLKHRLGSQDNAWVMFSVLDRYLYPVGEWEAA
jgi:hypothetical protein